MTYYARQKTERKLETYFEALRSEGVNPPESVSGISKAQIEAVLKRLDLTSRDLIDVVFCLMDDQFPNLFSSSLSISDGASTAHLGGYVGIFLRRGPKLDREGRDYWIKPLVDLGIVELVTYGSDGFVIGHIKAKSPNSAYRLQKSFIELLQNFSEEKFGAYFDKNQIATRLILQSEATEASLRKYGRGGHYELIQFAIHFYAGNFLKDYRVIYVDDSDGKRISEEEENKLKSVGIDLILKDAFPDVILISGDSRKLWFIEAVTSDGEVDMSKVQKLKEFCERNNKVLAGMTTAYPDWKTSALRQSKNKNLAPGSYLWIAEDPSRVFLVESFVD